MADLIDRAALIEHIETAGKKYDVTVSNRCTFREIAREVPAIDAVPVVHARWMHDPHDISTFYAGDCSNCGCAPKRRTMSFKPWNYCPNCGARMDADAPERDGKDINVPNKDAPERAGKDGRDG